MSLPTALAWEVMQSLPAVRPCDLCFHSMFGTDCQSDSAVFWCLIPAHRVAKIYFRTGAVFVQFQLFVVQLLMFCLLDESKNRKRGVAGKQPPPFRALDSSS